MITLSSNNDTVDMVSWQDYHINMITLSYYYKYVIMLSLLRYHESWLLYHFSMITLLCYHDNMLSYFFLKISQMMTHTVVKIPTVKPWWIPTVL
jgi:hypothetical protein